MKNSEKIGSLDVEIEEESPSGDLEYAPTEMTIEDIDAEINEHELDIKELRALKSKMQVESN